jgi:hypothetical protein
MFRNGGDTAHLYTMTAPDQRQQQIQLCGKALRGNVIEILTGQRISC